MLQPDGSGEQFGDRPTFVEYGEDAITAVAKLVVPINPQKVIDRGEDVAGRVALRDRVGSVRIGFTDDLTDFQTAPRKEDAGGAGPMVSTGIFIDLRSPAEFPIGDDHDPFVESPFEKILDQGDNSPIEPLATILHGIEAMEIDGVIIPVTDPTA